MNVVISRKYGEHSTTGKLAVFDGDSMPFVGVTIELPWLGNKKNKSCIPEGKYSCTKVKSERHGDCFLVQDVPGRTAIMVHKGNFAPGDTEGCILPGLHFDDINLDGNIDVAMSTIAMQRLNKLLPAMFDLTILS